MRAAVLVLAATLYLGGAFALFTSHAVRGRLIGLASLATGGLATLAAVRPAGGAVLAVTVVSAVTLSGLLLVAWAMERTARRADGTDLRIDVDPLRWS